MHLHGKELRIPQVAAVSEDLMYGTVRSAGDPPVGRKAVEDERSQGLRDAVKPLNFGIPHGIFF